LVDFFTEISISERSSKFEVVFDGAKKLRKARAPPMVIFIIYIKANKNIF
jgi:hypothetical protein